MIKNKQLNISILDFDDIRNPLLAAGQAKATVEVGSRLAKNGHKITVLCSKYPGYKDRTEFGIKYKHIGFGSKYIRLNNFLYILTLPFSVRKIEADLIVECFTAPISTLFTPLWTKIPVVAVPTSFEADRFAKLYHFPFDVIEKFGSRFYKYFLPYTAYLDQKMKKINPTIISKIVPEGVGKEFFSIKKIHPQYILYLGRYDMNQKGIDLLLEAYSKVAKKIKYPLIIAGTGPDEKKIKKMVNDLKLDPYVKIMGSAYGRKKMKLLSKALYVTMPSRHEGFSLFSLEALASGLPLVVFDIPGMSWMNGEVSFKAKAFDTDSYAQLLTKASDENRIQKMSFESRKFAKQFTWDNVSNQFESFFFQILKQNQ